MSPTIAVIGVGPGLGMSVAHRFGREGYRVALVSRSAARHADYRASLAGAGVGAETFVADVRDRDRLLSTVDTIAERHGRIDVVYYGPGAIDADARPTPITDVDRSSVERAMSWVYPAVDVAAHVLPGMLERGEGGLLFAGGLSSVVPLPALGNLALSSAALRNYALTLNAGVAERGVYAGTLTIGGLVERGDIHQLVLSMNPGEFATDGAKTLNPDDLADAAWDMFVKRDRAETVFNTLT